MKCPNKYVTNQQFFNSHTEFSHSQNLRDSREQPEQRTYKRNQHIYPSPTTTDNTRLAKTHTNEQEKSCRNLAGH